MELSLEKLDSLTERLSAMHAADAVQALDKEDRRTITEAAQAIENIADLVRKARKQRADLHQALVKIIVDALLRCPDEPEEAKETAGNGQR